MQLDRFQKEAIQHITNGHSVLVSAPTGAGKTIIAEEVISKTVKLGRKVIYTSPIKALSNQKYRDFSKQFKGRAGIITGDVNLNPDGDILIMTTEIFRNRVLDRPQMMQNHDWIIFDEVHFLDDYERGTAWEESIMFLPSHMNILALSATVPNIDEMANWIKSIHKKEIYIVEEKKRPVPLKFHYQCNNKIIGHINGLKKYAPYFSNPDRRRSRRNKYKEHYLKPLKHNRLTKLIDEVKKNDDLPCIYFCFSRKKCESIATELSAYDFFVKKKERDSAIAYFDELLERFDLANERSAIDMRTLIEKGIAFHHAGMLPRLKEAIEEMFTHKLIKFIFTTETFALGINMPARAVIFDELRKFYGTHFATLRVRDFFQMAGRAGRRGMDDYGNVYSIINPRYISLSEIQHIVFGQTERVVSQFNSGYATLLNLYGQLRDDLVSAYPLSFHCYQSSANKQRKTVDTLMRRIEMLKDKGYIRQNELTDKGVFAASIYGYELPLAEIFADGIMEGLDPIELNILICSYVYEPRKNQSVGRLSKTARKISQIALTYSEPIYKWEKKNRIGIYSKFPYFHAAAAIEAFSKGTDFQKLYKFCDIDEGELIRVFRMVIQVLREIRSSKVTTHHLSEIAHNAINLINRDIIDAEAELNL